MYIIACRTHFCHLLGIGQVGHSPRETSGSAGTLDWGPMWLGSQFTCHPNTFLTPPTPLTPCWCPLMAPDTPCTPWETPNALISYLYPFWLLSTYTPCQPQYTPDTPTPLTPCWCPLMAPTPPSPSRSSPLPPSATYTLLAPEYLHFLPAPIHPWHPLHPMTTPWCP